MSSDLPPILNVEKDLLRNAVSRATNVDAIVSAAILINQNTMLSAKLLRKNVSDPRRRFEALKK